METDNGFGVIILAVAVGCAYGVPRNPEPCRVDANEFSADDSDCSLFYRCDYRGPFYSPAHGSWSARFSCPPGLHFDTRLHICNWPSVSNCQAATKKTDSEACRSLVCQNGGTCVVISGAPVCKCPARFRGSFCEQGISVFSCTSDPCQNGGSCVQLVGSYFCACPQGFSGVNCQNGVACSGNSPCVNGGICHTSMTGFFCTCPAGFFGATCEMENCSPATSLPCPAFNDPAMFYPYPDWQDPRKVHVCNSSGRIHTLRCRDDEIYNPFSFKCISATTIHVRLVG